MGKLNNLKLKILIPSSLGFRNLHEDELNTSIGLGSVNAFKNENRILHSFLPESFLPRAELSSNYKDRVQLQMGKTLTYWQVACSDLYTKADFGWNSAT